MNNNFSMKVLAALTNESFIRGTICAFFALLDPTVDEIEDVKTAVSEAITNSIIHGYENRPNSYINVYVEIKDAKTLYISIKDNGIGIEDVNKAREPFYTTKKLENRSGMGFTLMETFMDSVEVKSKLNEGTEVILIKKINGD